MFVLLACGSASAQGINLAWDDCGSYGTSNKFGTATFSCNTNASSADRTSRIVGSYMLRRPLQQVVGNDIELVLMASDPVLAPWCDFTSESDPHGCRAGQLTYEFRSETTSCEDWPGFSPVSGVLRAQAGVGGANRERLSMFCAFTLGIPERLDASVEYVSFVLTINNAKTVGAGSCSGCAAPVCIMLTSITVPELFSPTDPVVLTTPLVSNFVTWNDAAGSLSCALSPVRRSTWGQVKGMYR
jgi:hypothetical protein